MAITTYSELKDAIVNWTHRGDLTDRLDEFIDITESKMNRKLRLSEMEARATTTANAEYTALPSDYLEMRNIQLNTSTGKVLEYMTPHQMDMYDDSTTGEPSFYTIIGDEIQLVPNPSGDYTLEIDYYKEITPLDSTNTTNFVLDGWPEIYLYGCLQQAFMYSKSASDAAFYGQEFERLIEEANRVSRKRKYSGAPMMVRPA